MPEVQQPIVGQEPKETFEDKYGYLEVRKAVLKAARKGVPVRTICELYDTTPPAVYALCKRNKIILKTSPKPQPEISIYALLCPISGEVRYVGKSRNPEKRLIGHFHKPANKDLKKWLDDLRESALLPVVQIIAKVKWKYRNRAERALIRKFAKTSEILNKDY
jgi:hypothetical protein